MKNAFFLIAIGLLLFLVACEEENLGPVSEIKTEESGVKSDDLASVGPIVIDLSISEQEFNNIVTPVLQGLDDETSMLIEPVEGTNTAVLNTVPTDQIPPIVFHKGCTEQTLEACNLWAMDWLKCCKCALSANQDENGIYHFYADCP